MKTSIAALSRLLLAGATFCLPMCSAHGADEDSSAAPAAPAQPVPATAAPADATAKAAAAPAAPAKLPYGVDDVLKLSRAQISEDITLNFIQNSGTAYSLGPNDIVYLRNEGVSDRVINAMLDQRKRVAAETAAMTAVPVPVETPSSTATYSAAPADASTVSVASPYAQPTSAPAPTEAPVVQSAPAPSTVYVIPYLGATTAYYGSYAYYGPSSYGYCYSPYRYYGPGYYGGYCGPVVSFGFRFGGGGHYHFHR